jgi:hypothetical protein
LTPLHIAQTQLEDQILVADSSSSYCWIKRLSLGYVAACSHIQLALRHRGVDVLARKDEEWWHMMNFFYYGIVIFIVIKKKEANRKFPT